ncbi:iron hydroxylase [Nocardia panacis]|uniref:Iron hydroxylase n=1 Tax=Nocardia panacis TaxID=2340916 RepID=A0A3A4KRU3_9NOCA|nr:TauD/TfdA family dioxygenase [Nocardia panacis]RJO75878.1 iron hydroxylase [Nocardia panacis]
MKSVLPERKTLHPSNIEQRGLPADAAAEVRAAAREIRARLGRSATVAARTLDDPAIIDEIDSRAKELPESVRETLRPPETAAGATVVRGLPLTDAELGPTPPDWRTAAAWSADPDRAAASLELDLCLLLLARSTGEPFGWHGQQDGRLVNNIVPASGHEHEQSGASSETLLSPHTEDAFHPGRAHLLMLCCLRNPDRVGTTVSSVRRVRLTQAQTALLSAPTLPILPDVSYGSGHETYSAPMVPTIWFNPDGEPTLRYDPAYTPLDAADPEFRSAYARLTGELERVCARAALAPGELLLVDNDVAVHGRVPFTARYDGTDRWLKRVNIRLPQRYRRAEEAEENGFGQTIVLPFRTGAPTGHSSERDAAHDRGPVEHP